MTLGRYNNDLMAIGTMMWEDIQDDIHDFNVNLAAVQFVRRNVYT